MFDLLSDIVGSGHVRKNEPLSRHTSFQIGGPCDYFVLPHTAEEIQQLIRLCQKSNIPFFILGNGSNLLVSDAGFRGVVIHIGDQFAEVAVSGQNMHCKAGTRLTALSRLACQHGLSGLEFAAGIPGTAGGGIIMNAGAYGGEICQVLQSVLLMDETGTVFSCETADLELGYRSSLPAKKGWIVLEADFRLAQDDPDIITARMQEFNRRRREKQPLEFPSAGSTFKRPEGYFAGKLIADAGLSGRRVGGACVSPKHNGFVINTGGATAADVLTLIREVRQCVYDRFSVELMPEVRFLGFDAPETAGLIS